jgi:hypothetical protein
MSKLFDDSSLAMIPSAVKDGKLYSIRPTPEYGAEEVTNGNFATDSNWAKGGGTTISGGKANIIGDGSTYASITQNSVFTTGKKYRVSVDVVINSGLGLKVQDGATNENIGFATSSGTYVFDFTAGANTSLVISRRTGGTAFNSSVDNVSVKEITNSGDFTFSRGSNLAATRVDVNGLIEKGRENLLLQSNQFDTTWVQSGATLTSGQSGYDGSSDAWLLTKNASFGRLDQTISSSGVQTYSVYAKANDSDWIYFRADYSGGVASGYFDLVNGVGGSFGNIIDSDITSVGGGWYRIQIVFNATTTIVRIYPAEDNNQSGGTSGSTYIQNAQLESSMVATDYIETGASTAQAGILEDLPRLDYSGGASCPSLLLEPSRTNLVSQSEYYGGSDWSRTRCGFVTNTSETLSPEGIYNASKMTSTAIQESYAQDNVTLGSTSGTFTFFAKKGDLDYCHALVWDISANGRRQWFNLATGAVGATTNFGSGYTKVGATIEDYGNGWYRCSFSWSGGSTTSGVRINISSDDGEVDSPINSYGYFYGAQCEAGVSYATSYIPTYGSAVTRSSDQSVKQNADLIGQTEGVLYWEGSLTYGENDDVFFIGDYTNSIAITKLFNNQLRFYIRQNGVQTLLTSSAISSVNENLKVAFAYKSGDIVGYANGSQVVSSSIDLNFSATIPNIALSVNPFWLNKAKRSCKQALVFKTRLTNAELAALTTI